MSMAHRIQKIQSNQNSRTNPNRWTVRAIRRQAIPATEVAPAKAGRVEAVKLKECFESFQLKYDVDKDSPWWKKAFFWYVYMPFARFSYFKVGIVPMDHVNDKGELGWLERQTVWSERWQALQDAERYPFGGVERLPFNALEQDCTCPPLSEFPNSKARERYERSANKTVSVTESSLERLDRKLTETDPLVSRYRAKPI